MSNSGCSNSQWKYSLDKSTLKYVTNTQIEFVDLLIDSDIEFTYSSDVPIGDYYFTVTGYLMQSWGYL